LQINNIFQKYPKIKCKKTLIYNSFSIHSIFDIDKNICCQKADIVLYLFQ